MASIYENSRLTLAATRAADANAGCFVTVEQPIAAEVQVTGEHDESCSVFVRRQITHFEMAREYGLAHDWPLNARA